MTTDELRAIAEAATPGPWEEFYDDPECGTWCLIQTDSIGLIREDAPVVASSVTGADARHIATFDPRRALAACDLADAARLVVDMYEAGEQGIARAITRFASTLARWEAL